MKGLKKFFRISTREKGLFFEAFFWLMGARLVLLFLPFKKIAPHLGKHMEETPPDFPAGSPAAKLYDDVVPAVSLAIRRASGRTPWESACLVQALAAKMMLKCRRFPSTLYLGMAKDENKHTGLKAHAWVRCGDTIVSGNEGINQYTVVSTFGDISL